MDYRAEFERQDAVINGIVERYREMLNDDDLEDRVAAVIGVALYKIGTCKDPFVFGLSGPEFGGTSEARAEGWSIPEAFLPLRVELGRALTARALARQRGNLSV